MSKATDSPVQSSPGKSTSRLASLDVFRGITILAMILVNNPGDWGQLYAPLAHAEWFGWTPTDLIFPFFLFIVGAALAYSLRKYREGDRTSPAVYVRIARRTATLILLGWGMGVFAKWCDVWFGNASGVDLTTLRLPGVLVRIGLVYGVASLIVLHVPQRGQLALAAALVLGYWALMRWTPDRHDYQSNLSPDGNIVRVVDRTLLGDSHLYTQGKREKTDPEGLLSTLPAIVTTLMGYWAGLVILRRGVAWRTVAVLAAFGVVATAVGLAWGMEFPISKKLWTSSFVMLTGGLGMIALAACLAVFDLLAPRAVAHPFEIVGVNAIFVFVASGMTATLLGRMHIGGMSAHRWLYEKGFLDHLADPKLASLACAAATVAAWWVILWLMSLRGWTIRV